MDFTDYLEPVELEKPEAHYLQSDNLFSKTISIHTENNPIGDLTGFDLAILGVPEDRNSPNKGCSLAPNKIRAELYKLIRASTKKKIIDLGNIKLGNTFSDTYFALRETIQLFLEKSIPLVVFGGTQELTLCAFQAYEYVKSKINLVTVDSKIDFTKHEVNFTSDSYLTEILLKKRKLFKFSNIGHQIYLTDKPNLDLIQTLYHDAFRLGEVRSDMRKIEPIIRDADIVSFDVGAIRQSDSPGHFRSSPNGFYSEESCQISRYAGMSDSVNFFGVFEVNPKLDQANQSTSLAAQMVWHFLDGFEHRSIEIPSDEDNNYKTFIVGHTDLDYEMTFYKSLISERWWMEVPNVREGGTVLTACSYNDYLAACDQEVPDLWWKTYQKLC